MSRVLRHVRLLSADQVAERVVQLYRQHSSEVTRVMDDAFRTHASEIREGKLPPTCAIILALPENYRVGMQAARPEAEKPQDGPTKMPAPPSWSGKRSRQPTMTSGTSGSGRGLVPAIRWLVRIDPPQGRHELYRAIAQVPRPYFSCRELQTAVLGNPVGRAVLDNQDKAKLRVANPVKDEILDTTAIKQCKERLVSIEAELREAEQNNDIGQRERLSYEKEMIVEQLTKATALGGRPRTFTDDDERARKAVGRALSMALNKIAKHHLELAKHLKDRIDRGAHCCYQGDGIAWET